MIRKLTAPNDIIAGDSNHNSPITMSGRKMFLGYDGTLNSHGIDYSGRYEAAKSIETMLPRLREEAAKSGCGAFILNPTPEALQRADDASSGLARTESPLLLRVNPVK
jgi:hypothetical protein